MKLLREEAKKWGLVLRPEQLEAFEIYYRELRRWNQRYNLTAIIEYEEVQLKHFLDSLSLYRVDEIRKLLNGSRKVRIMDVGTGAGFPGLPIKIAFPSCHLTLLDATRKKTRFLEHLVHKLGLEAVEVVWGRAEEVAHRAVYRERYDLVIARAVAEMAILAEYTLPFCRVGGMLVAYKGEKAHAEVLASQEAFSILGGELRRIVGVEVPRLKEHRYLVVVDKTASTPLRYPRRPGMPAKRPIGRKAPTAALSSPVELSAD